MINPHEVQACLAHQSKIDINLIRRPKITSIRVRLEWSVGDAFNKKLPVAFEKEFRYRANSQVHSGNFLVEALCRRKDFKIAAVHKTALDLSMAISWVETIEGQSPQPKITVHEVLGL